MDEEHLHDLYNILSDGILDEYDLQNMGPLYREKSVYILNNGRLDMDLEQGVKATNIENLINKYFTYVNEVTNDSKINEYIKSQIMHFYFVYIHPYFDVNGRTSRTLAMWYLLKKEAYPYIIFNRGISFKGSKYDKIIKEAKERCDLTKFLEMMLDTLKIELEKESEETSHEVDLKKLVTDFMKMENVTREMIVSLVDKITVSEDKKIKIYYK